MTFTGFTPEAIDFFWMLQFNNNREWFLEHKQEYLDLLSRPLHDLGMDLFDSVLETYPDLEYKVTRIYQDVRIGRGPYKDHLMVMMREIEGGPDFIFYLSPQYYMYTCGMWQMNGDMLERYRKMIREDKGSIRRLAEGLTGSPFVISGDEFKRSKGDVGEPLNSWYNRKVVRFEHREACGSKLFSPALVNEITEGFRFLKPYYMFLRDVADVHSTDSTEDRRIRKDDQNA